MMSSTMKPVMSQGNKTPPVSSQINKQIHPQGIPTTYAQSISHMPQNLINVPHNTNVHSNAHSIAHHVNTNVHNTNHYSLNVPNAPQHFPISGNSPALHSNTHAHSGMGHSIGSFGNPSKTPLYEPNYQSNQGQLEKSPTLLPVQNNSLPQSSSGVRETDAEAAPAEKVQSNGTQESTVSTKDPKPSFASSPVKDKPNSTPVQQAEKPVLTIEKKVETSENLLASQEKSQTQTASVPNVPEQKIECIVKPDESSNSSSVESNDSEPSEKPVSANSSDVPESTSSVMENISSTPSSSEPSETVSPKITPNDNESKKEESKEIATKEASKTSPSKEQAQQPASTNPKSSTLKLATTARTPVRKSKAKSDAVETPKPSSKNEKSPTQRSPGSMTKAKRNRIRTQHYQSPLPEVEMISKMTSSNTPRNKNNEDRLIIFFKNEFLAVRNADGSFYVCQAVQNIYKSSPRIRIRWLSQDKNDKSGELYTPDFYDYTDFDCILTNLNLERIEKGKFRLPPKEKDRTDNILKRALAVEQGDSKVPSLTEEHPDGIDLSLYKEESQLKKKRRPTKRKASSPLRSPAKLPTAGGDKKPETPKVKKKVQGTIKQITRKQQQQTAAAVEKKTAGTATSASTMKRTASVGGGRAERAKRRLQGTASVSKPAASASVDSKKAKVLAKMAKKRTGVSVPVTKITKPAVRTTKAAVSRGQKQPPSKQVSQPQQQVRKSRRGRK